MRKLEEEYFQIYKHFQKGVRLVKTSYEYFKNQTSRIKIVFDISKGEID